MSIRNETLVIPREAPVYASDAVKVGIASSVGLQSLRVRQGRVFTRYLDIPVSLVDRVEHGGVWLSQAANQVFTVARTVSSATAPDSPSQIQSVEHDDVRSDIAADSITTVAIPYHGAVYALGGAKIGIVADATRTAMVVRVGMPFPYRISLPLSLVDRVEDEAVWLNVSYDDAKRIGAGVMSPPATTADRGELASVAD